MSNISTENDDVFNPAERLRSRRPPPPRQFNAFWLLLLILGALVYAGYYFYFRTPEPVVVEMPMPGCADDAGALIEQVLLPMDEGPEVADLQVSLYGLEQRLAAERDNPELQQYGKNICLLLRDLLKVRAQCETAIASIQAGRFEGLGGSRTSADAQSDKHKAFALQEQARIWQRKAEQAKPTLTAALARLRQSENR
ncbi:MAG: hypothetical protein ACOYCD_06705 [Kiritimatiellia bacterium]|jgi:hypothetical protein